MPYNNRKGNDFFFYLAVTCLVGKKKRQLTALKLAGAIKSERIKNEAKQGNEHVMLQPVVDITVFLSFESLIKCMQKFRALEQEKRNNCKEFRKTSAFSCAKLKQEPSCHGQLKTVTGATKRANT